MFYPCRKPGDYAVVTTASDPWKNTDTKIIKQTIESEVIICEIYQTNKIYSKHNKVKTAKVRTC